MYSVRWVLDLGLSLYEVCKYPIIMLFCTHKNNLKINKKKMHAIKMSKVLQQAVYENRS